MLRRPVCEGAYVAGIGVVDEWVGRVLSVGQRDSSTPLSVGMTWGSWANWDGSPPPSSRGQALTFPPQGGRDAKEGAYEGRPCGDDVVVEWVGRDAKEVGLAKDSSAPLRSERCEGHVVECARTSFTRVC